MSKKDYKTIREEYMNTVNSPHFNIDNTIIDINEHAGLDLMEDGAWVDAKIFVSNDAVKFCYQQDPHLRKKK